MISALTVAWCGLWGEISTANLLAGLGIAVAVTTMGIGTPGTGGVQLWPLLRFIGIVAVDLARSTIHVATEIVTPTDYTDESILAVDLPHPSREHLLMLVVAVTLTPGTAVVDADPDTGTLYLHLLHHGRRDATVEHVHQLARLACAALPGSHPERTSA